MSRDHGLLVKRRSIHGAFVTLSIFFLFTSWRSIKFDPDGMHEGFHLLLAVSASEGKLPPEVFTRYGIIQPIIEGLWLSLTKSNLVALRTLTFLIILAMFVGILLIGKCLIDRKWYWVPALMWLAINPINDIYYPLTQSTWPNLLGQLLVLWILIFLLRLESFGYAGNLAFIALGVLIGTLPFIRIQFLPQMATFLIFIACSFGKRKALIGGISCLFTPVFWALFFETNNQSILTYLDQVTFVGISEKERLGRVQDVMNNYLDFVVALIMPGLFVLMFIIVTELIKTRELTKLRKYCFVSIIIFAGTIMGRLSSYDWWLNTISKVQYWFCGGAILISLLVLFEIRIQAKAPKRSSLQAFSERNESKIALRYSKYLLALFITTLLPPLTFNNGYLRLISHLVLIPALVLFNRSNHHSINEISKKFLAILLSTSLILSITGAVRYQMKTRIQLLNSSAYIGMLATTSKVEENRMESSIISEMVKNVESQKSKINEVYFNCSNGIYHVNEDIVYGDTLKWYRLDMREGSPGSVIEEINSLPKENLIIGCMYSKGQILALEKTKLVKINLLKYSSYSNTYSFLAQKT